MGLQLFKERAVRLGRLISLLCPNHRRSLVLAFRAQFQAAMTLELPLRADPVSDIGLPRTQFTGRLLWQ